MPTRKPRMALTLPDHVAAAIHDLADATERPAATLVSELLEEMVPQLEGLAKYARAIKAGKRDAAKSALTRAFGDAMGRVMAEQAEMFREGSKS